MADKSSADIKAKESKSAKAGLSFPVARFQRHLRKGNYANHIGTAGSVYLTGVIEYLVAEILELSGSAAAEHHRVRIVPRHVMMAVRNDVELNELLKDAYFSESGVMPNIHPLLINRSKPKTVARNDTDSGNIQESAENDEDMAENDENSAEDNEDSAEDDEDSAEDDEDSADDADASAVVGSQNF